LLPVAPTRTLYRSCRGSFEVGYVAEDASAHRVALTDAWAVRFEATAPVRRFYSRKAQRHLPGRWWSATDGVHVGYESWLERDHLIAMDFDQDYPASRCQGAGRFDRRQWAGPVHR
jgi:hypothetical protein